MSIDDIDLGRLLYEINPTTSVSTIDFKKHIVDGIQRLSELGLKEFEPMKEMIDVSNPKHRERVFEPFHELDQKYVALARGCAETT